MYTLADELLIEAVDTHCHVYPQLEIDEPGRVDDFEWALLAKAAGMKGFVLKSHVWPTMERAYIVNKLVPGVEVMGSIVLNNNVGGINLFAIESAIKLGAKLFFLPTWTSKNDIQMNGWITRVKLRMKSPMPGEPQEMLDENGKLRPEIQEGIRMIKEADIALATGHISVGESLKVADAAKEIGFKKLIFNHPLIWMIKATDEAIDEMKNKGAYIEYTFTSSLPMHERIDPRQIAESIKKVGAQHSVMATDAILDWNPYPTEILRMFIASMIGLGFSKTDIKTMVSDNPSYLMNLK